MKKSFLILIALLCALVCLFGCGADPTPTEPPTEASTAPTETDATTVPTEPETTTEPTEPEPTKPEHSEFYIPELSVDDVILYFNEVCLDAEFINSGNPTLIQRWDEVVYYTIDGDPTEDDLAVLNTFCTWLNTIEGFPGIQESTHPKDTNLRIFFCDQERMIDLLGDNFYGMDGGVTFWYNHSNQIYSSTICYLNSTSQFVRNSVILEEIYNGLGPVQDTDLRTDSIIYAGYSEPQALTPVDELILKLLYHPSIQCGMNAQECEEMIRQLYY